MAKALLEHLWKDRKQSVLIALELIRRYSKEDNGMEESDNSIITTKLSKANSRLQNLIAMRADGEITKEEYHAMRETIDAEIQKLQSELENTKSQPAQKSLSNLNKIEETLNKLIDFSAPTVCHEIINQFVYKVTPTSDTTFEWYINLSNTKKAKASYSVEGRKKNSVIKLEEIEEISSLHKLNTEDINQLIIPSSLLSLLHRQLSKVDRSLISLDLPLTFEQASAFRKANGKYVRKNQWKDTTLTVYIDID